MSCDFSTNENSSPESSSAQETWLRPLISSSVRSDFRKNDTLPYSLIFNVWPDPVIGERELFCCVDFNPVTWLVVRLYFRLKSVVHEILDFSYLLLTASVLDEWYTRCLTSVTTPNSVNPGLVVNEILDFTSPLNKIITWVSTDWDKTSGTHLYWWH